MTTPAPSNSPRVLVADDDPVLRTILVTILEDEGDGVVAAANGQDALELALAQDVELILLDLGMPRLSGEAFCRTYRERGGHAPVILVTASQPDAVAAAITACGAVASIPKPFEINQ